jgi:hypothetical protein
LALLMRGNKPLALVIGASCRGGMVRGGRACVDTVSMALVIEALICRPR